MQLTARFMTLVSHLHASDWLETAESGANDYGTTFAICVMTIGGITARDPPVIGGLITA